MKSRIATKIVYNIMEEKGFHYTKNQVQKAYCKWINVFDKPTQISAISCVISASCGDTYPFRFGDTFMSYDLASTIGKYF